MSGYMNVRQKINMRVLVYKRTAEGEMGQKEGLGGFVYDKNR